MSLRERFTADLKTAMKAHDGKRVSTIRLITARIKDADIAARPKGVEHVGDDELAALLRSMIKQRRDSIALFRQGGREELAAGEEAEIAVIEDYLPRGLDAAALDGAVDVAIRDTGATGARDLGRVMAALKASHGASVDMKDASAIARAKLGGDA